MSLRKTADMKTPHAVFEAGGGWTWKVLKVNAPKKNPVTGYATWLVAAQSPMTFGGWDMGDTYAGDVLRYGQCTAMTDEFKAYMTEHGL